MVKAALASLLVHGALVLALRTSHAPPSPPKAVVELEVIRHEKTVAPTVSTTVAPAVSTTIRPTVSTTLAPQRAASRSIAMRSTTSASVPSSARAIPSSPSTPASTSSEAPALPRPNLFSASAIGHAAGVDLDAPAPASFRPKQGVGSIDGRGGVGVVDFLAEDAGRERAQKGLVPPFVRDMERKLDGYFDPPFAHVDNANRKELMHKQFMGFLKTPPKTGELARGIDPAKETTAEKLKSTGDHAFFLGRRVLVFARQRADGSIAELSIRQASGFRAFDADALDAVEKALEARPPRAEELHSGEVRTLWQLDATGYVVLAPEPTLKFDESTGKSEWIYPLQRRVDKAVKLIAIY